MLNLCAVVPHRVTTDDHYREYDIPQGCMMIANTWSVMHTFRENLTIDSHYCHGSRSLQGNVA